MYYGLLGLTKGFVRGLVTFLFVGPYYLWLVLPCLLLSDIYAYLLADLSTLT